jgi:hypothetical protein
MSSPDGHGCAHLVRQQAPDDERVEKNRRLGVLGPGQFLDRSFPADSTERNIQDGIRSFEQLHRTCICHGEVSTHADELGSLPGHQYGQALQATSPEYQSIDGSFGTVE